MKKLESVVSKDEMFSLPQECGDSEFEERILESETDLRKSFRLRYEVYCEEKAFLPETGFPDGLETDVYDQASLHFGSFNMADTIVGTVRLVRSETLAGLPMSEHCLINPEHESRFQTIANVAEVSRLAISRNYRRRANDGQYGLAVEGNSGMEKAIASDRRQATFPTVLRLYRAMYHALKRNGIEHVTASMEVSLHRILRALRFPFHEIGPEADYYGPVRPYYLHIPELDRQLLWARPQLLQYFNTGLEPRFKPASLGALAIASMATRLRES